ncbi:class I SAM-dependent methyltransferase [Streptomyces sp. SL13]|uniref:Class I SAM-dependent methyltransferase n=1 Tax=Streptantibioticus silvisoli TaxID=2705255 RepID=A0AA90H0B9_9ACTN|nr:class I SAM-dependent methyltransferase [Streptantibioticus silvisoli]MDI5971643.1 class I SAM-dependent methyltransferase [Streptantibioticus silvisoli]
MTESGTTASATTTCGTAESEPAADSGTAASAETPLATTASETVPATEQGWLDRNRANWDDRVAVHAASDFYDLAGFRAGASTLRPFEPAELGDVAGRSLLHLQCHMGQDTLSWACRGAKVTGLDFSVPAVEVGTRLAAEIGLADRARFVVADVHDAVRALAGERFDVVYTGLGALGWLPDLTRWARVASSLLAERGVLYLVEFHPFTDMLDEEGRTVERDYFTTSGQAWDEPYTYTDGPPLTRTVSIQWDHTLGEVITALGTVGLRVEFLHEHDATAFERFSVLERGEHGEYRFPAGHPRVPLMYSLRASRP